MVKLSELIEKLEKTFEITIKGFYDQNAKVNTIKFITGNKESSKTLSAHTIYITELTDFVLPFGSIVLVLNTTILKNLLNVLYIEQPISILNVYNVINEEIMESLNFNLKKEEMFNVLQKGGGIKGIINIAYSILENPITVCDTNFSILESILQHDNDIDFEQQGETKFLKIDSIQSMQRKKIVDKIFNSKNAFFAYNEISDLKVIFCSIRINKFVVGYICVIERSRPLTERDLDFTEITAKMISVEMQKTGFYVERNGLVYESLLKDLIENRFDNVQYVKQRMFQLGHELTTYYYMICFTFDDSHEKRVNTGYYIEQINTIFSKGMCFFYNGHPVLLLLSDDKTNPFSELEKSRLESFLSFNKLYAVVSYPFTNILDASPFYHQSLDMLNLLPISDSNEEHILYYEDYCLQHIFNKCATQISLYATIHPDILFLKNYDQVNRTEYLKTLGCYIKLDRNAVKASQSLNIHKSTFFYRLSKISDLIGLSYDDGKKFFLYQLSFQILDSMNI